MLTALSIWAYHVPGGHQPWSTRRRICVSHSAPSKNILTRPTLACLRYLNSITNLPPLGEHAVSLSRTCKANPAFRFDLSLAILYYDYLLTLPLEIQFLWSPGKQGWLTVACLLNRYLAVFGHIPLAVSYMLRRDDLPVRLSRLSRSAAAEPRPTAVVSYRDARARARLDEQNAYQPAPVQLSGLTSIPRGLRIVHAVTCWLYVLQSIIIARYPRL